MLFWVVQPGHSACVNGHCRVFIFALGKVPVSPSQLTVQEVVITAATASYTVPLPLCLMVGKQLSEPKAAWGIPPFCSSHHACWLEETSPPGTTESWHYRLITAWLFVTENRVRWDMRDVIKCIFDTVTHTSGHSLYPHVSGNASTPVTLCLVLSAKLKSQMRHLIADLIFRTSSCSKMCGSFQHCMETTIQS